MLKVVNHMAPQCIFRKVYEYKNKSHLSHIWKNYKNAPQTPSRLSFTNEVIDLH